MALYYLELEVWWLTDITAQWPTMQVALVVAMLGMVAWWYTRPPRPERVRYAPNRPVKDRAAWFHQPVRQW